MKLASLVAALLFASVASGCAANTADDVTTDVVVTSERGTGEGYEATATLEGHPYGVSVGSNSVTVTDETRVLVIEEVGATAAVRFTDKSGATNEATMDSQDQPRSARSALASFEDALHAGTISRETEARVADLLRVALTVASSHANHDVTRAALRALHAYSAAVAVGVPASGGLTANTFNSGGYQNSSTTSCSASSGTAKCSATCGSGSTAKCSGANGRVSCECVSSCTQLSLCPRAY